MREILFRGKRIDNGEWIEGSLWLYGEDAHIFGGPDFPYGCLWHKVDPSTAGQYTGLTDKNGKRIFEGDIVCLRTGRCHEVKYGDGCFYMDGTAITAKYLDRFTVIGNIHDNPELLENP